MLPGTYLVTGSCGLVGRSLIMLLSKCPEVKVIATFNKCLPEIFADNIKYVNIDLSHDSLSSKIQDKIDYVFMLAGKVFPFHVLKTDPIDSLIDHVNINMKTLEFAYLSNVKKIVCLSSCTGYPNKPLLVESDMFLDDPKEKYFTIGWITRYIEKTCEMYSKYLNRKMTAIILRPTTIYGSNEGFDLNNCHFLPELVKKIVDRDFPIKLFGKFSDTRDLIHADDVARACCLALNECDNFEVFNLCGFAHTTQGMIDIIAEIEECKPVIEYNGTKNNISDSKINCSKINASLQFMPRISIKDGIRELVNKYKTISR